MNSKAPFSLFKLKSYPWICVTFCALFLFYKYVLQVSPSVITHALMRRYHLDGAGLGNLAATFFYTYLIVQLFAGPLLDKLGTRFLTALAILSCAMGAIWFSTAPTLFQAVCARSLIGAGAAFATVSYMKIAALWFKPEQFAFVAGLLATAAMLGSMCGQLPFALMVEHWGWQSSLFDCGVFGIVLSILFYVVVRGDPTHLSKNALSQEYNLSFRDVLTVLKCKPNWYLMFYSGLAFSPLAVFAGLWGDSFLQTVYHLSKPAAATLSSMSFLGLALGAPLFGFISDRMKKRFSVMLFGLLLSFFSLIVALYFRNNMSPFVEGAALFFFGLGTGAFMLVFPAGKDINSLAMTATVVALINTGDALIGTFTEPLLGKLLDIFGHHKMLNGIRYFSVNDYHLSMILLPLYLFIALFFLLALRKSIR
ncbi:MAG: MFS transporter [Gammaproteobacteria bacterium]|nr:MFS transporter [Gammaproteobacteria bacterium]